jgi:hypothetical protein
VSPGFLHHIMAYGIEWRNILQASGRHRLV